MQVGMTALAIAATLMLGGCDGKADERRHAADADANAAGFSPPSVTSRLDYGSSAARRFRLLDRNGDDVLTADELPRADSRLLELDRNRDGEITNSEFSEGMLTRFDRMDLNQDGAVTSEERRSARER